jgi:hypothetical protein
MRVALIAIVISSGQKIVRNRPGGGASDMKGSSPATRRRTSARQIVVQIVE